MSYRLMIRPGDWQTRDLRTSVHSGDAFIPFLLYTLDHFMLNQFVKYLVPFPPSQQPREVMHPQETRFCSGVEG